MKLLFVTEPPREWTMAKTIAIALPVRTSPLGRLLALIDHALMASARAAVRTSEPTYFGL